MGKALIIATGGGTDVEEGGPNATPSMVLSGYTFYAMQDDPQIGTMPNQTTAEEIVLSPEEDHPISLGYHNGEQIISTVELSSQTSATGTETDLLENTSGWSNGTCWSGKITNVGTAGDSISANGTYTVPVGWHNGQGSVTQSLSTQSATNVTPGTSQKTVIAASKWASGNQTVLGNGNLVAGNIKKNVTIFGVKGNYQIDVTQGYVATSGVSGGTISGGRWNTNNQYPSYQPLGAMGVKSVLVSYPASTINYYKNYFNVAEISANLYCYCSSAYSTVYFWLAAMADGNGNNAMAIGNYISGKGYRPNKWDGKYYGTCTGTFYLSAFGTISSKLEIYQVLSVNDSSGDLYQEGRATNLSVKFKKV